MELFSLYPSEGFFRVQAAEAAELIDQMPREQFLITKEDDLVDHIVGKYSVDALNVDEDHMTQDLAEMQIQAGSGWPPSFVPGTRIRILLPFTGNKTLWNVRPQPVFRGRPSGCVFPEGGVLEMTIDHPQNSRNEDAKAALDRNLELIRQHVERLKTEVATFNQALPDEVRNKIRSRRERLTKQGELAEFIAIPIVRKSEAPSFKPVAIERRIVRPLPAVPESGIKPEPGITSELYEEILSLIRHVGRTFETTPKSFRHLGEEDLRNFIIANLNGIYKGKATAETFRRQGKSDIRIEEDNRNAFVAECKIWKGQNSVTESLDQILGYLTWRDCKTAVVLFNKKVAGFSELLGKVQPTVETHPRFVKHAKASECGEWRFVLRSAEDEHRLIHVHAFLFNIYAELEMRNSLAT